MARKTITAVQLSDLFAKRFRDMYPLTRVTGLQIKAQGDGEWLPLGYLGRADEGTTVDAAALLQHMKTEFLIDE